MILLKDRDLCTGTLQQDIQFPTYEYTTTRYFNASSTFTQSVAN